MQGDAARDFVFKLKLHKQKDKVSLLLGYPSQRGKEVLGVHHKFQQLGFG